MRFFRRFCSGPTETSFRVLYHALFDFLARQALTRHQNWSLAWRSPAPKKRNDAVIISGGGHGRATAYYLAKEHGMTNIAMFEKGCLGGGNTGRNTTTFRSHYHLEPNGNLAQRLANTEGNGALCKNEAGGRSGYALQTPRTLRVARPSRRRRLI